MGNKRISQFDELYSASSESLIPIIENGINYKIKKTNFIFNSTDTYITGGTYNNGVTTLINNDNYSLTISGFSTGYTLTSSAITSTLGYAPLSAYTDTFTTGGTYSEGTLILNNNNGNSFSISGFSNNGVILTPYLELDPERDLIIDDLSRLLLPIQDGNSYGVYAIPLDIFSLGNRIEILAQFSTSFTTVLVIPSGVNVVLDGIIITDDYRFIPQGYKVILINKGGNDWVMTYESSGISKLSKILEQGNETLGNNIIISDGDAVVMSNGSKMRTGSRDNGFGGGISLECVAGYEYQWENGVLYLSPLGGNIVKATSINGVVPDASFDISKGWAVGSIYHLANTNVEYQCNDNTLDNAIWVVVNEASIPTLQQILDNNHSLVDHNNFQGTDAGFLNTGTRNNFFGLSTGANNTGSRNNAFGENSLDGNSGSDVNAMGENSGINNTGQYVNVFGTYAGIDNTFNNINLFGVAAQADENGQTVFSKDGSIFARLSTLLLTATRKLFWPDQDGTMATEEYVDTGLANKADLVGGLVPSSQLPPTVDEILEYNDLISFPPTGQSNKYYLALDTNKTYRWSGSVYTPINEGIALGETSSTAYRGDRGKIAYDHSQATGNPHGTTKNDIGLANVDNTSDLNKPISTAQQAALDLKKPLEIEEIISSSGTTNLNFSFNSYGSITQTGDIIINETNTNGNKKIAKTFLIQGSTNANHNITFPVSWKNLSGISADSTKMNFIEIILINGKIVYSINKYDIPDVITPTLLKSSILLDSLNTIELLYSEAIDSSVTTQTSWYTVAGKTVSSVTILTNKVRVVVSVPFTENDNPLVTFTNQVSGSGIQDAAGNKAANFSQNIGLTTYRIDNFNRTDSTTSINNPSDGGSNWVTPFGGVWGISSNKAYAFAANTSSAIAHAVYLESNESNVTLRGKFTFGTTGISSACFLARYVDANNHYLLVFGKLNTGQLYYSISKFVGGSAITVVANTNFGTWVSGTEYTFMAKCSGNSITLYNGTTALVQVTDSSLSGTKHGLRIFAGSGTTGNTDRFDDFGVFYG
jgi:hypothetical protein